MHRSIIRACLFLFVLTSSFAAHATGLGNFTLNSYLGQPFKAEIDIVSVNKEDIPTLSAKLASRKTFQHLNVDYAPFLFEFKISIENRINGQPYVKITSLQPVVEPFLSILIELNWSSGLLIREYTVLLDPPEDSLEPTLPAVQVEVVASPAKPEPATVGQPETRYVRVKSGDTLSKIAQKVAYPHVQLNQMLVAFHRANRKAFSGNNMNRLKTGPTLRIPDASEVVAISPDEADKEVKMQVANWELYRQKLAAEVSSADLAGEESAQIVTGKIAAKIDSSAKVTTKQPEEKLSISSGEGIIEGSNGENATSSTQDYIAALEDNTISKAKALNEANESVAILEKNIEKLQKLLELKDVGISGFQTPAGNTYDATTKIKLPPTITEESVLDNEGSVQEDKNSSGSVDEKLDADVPAAETTEPSSKVVPPPLSVKNSSLVIVEDTPMIDSLIENVKYVGVALLLLLIGVFAIGFAISRREKEAVNNDPTFEVDYSSLEKDKNASDNVVSMDSLVSDDTKDNDTSMNLSDESEPEEVTPAPVLTEADLADINLNIDNSVTTEAVDTESVEKSAQWHEMATKIDLARAYQEMGDNDGAKETLEEVLKDGDAEQQESAKFILDRL